jgi:hypothetical protein
MAYGPGKDGVFRVVGPQGGTAIDISAYITSLTAPSIDAQTAETSTLGDNFKEYIRTQVDPGTVSIEGIYDPFIGTFLFPLGTASAGSFEVGPQGTASGKPKFYGTALLSSYEQAGDIDSAVTFSAEFQLTGPVLQGTY